MVLQIQPRVAENQDSAVASHDKLVCKLALELVAGLPRPLSAKVMGGSSPCCACSGARASLALKGAKWFSAGRTLHAQPLRAAAIEARKQLGDGPYSRNGAVQQAAVPHGFHAPKVAECCGGARSDEPRPGRHVQRDTEQPGTPCCTAVRQSQQATLVMPHLRWYGSPGLPNAATQPLRAPVLIGLPHSAGAPSLGSECLPVPEPACVLDEGLQGEDGLLQQLDLQRPAGLLLASSILLPTGPQAAPV